jgi:hypothetical protein
MADFSPLIRNFPDDKRFSLNLYSEHIVVIVLIDGVFSEHDSLLTPASCAVFLIIEEMNVEINVALENTG